MKKIYLTFVSLMLMISVGFAQTVLENYYHTFKPGDEHHFIVANKAEEGKAGYQVTWDFSDLKRKSELKSHMLLTSEVEKSDEFPEANIVLEEYGTHFFFRMEGNSMKHYGTRTKNNTLIKYDQPFLKMVYPFEYGQAKKGNFHGTVKTQRSEQSFTGKYEIEVDGYGKLILPGEVTIEDVVRLKTVMKQTYENSNYTSTIVSYKWYCQQVRYPLLTVIRSVQPDKTYSMKTAYYANAKELGEKIINDNNQGIAQFDGDVNVYPNPFKNRFHMDYVLGNKGDVEVLIFDNAGKKIKEIRYKSQEAGVYSQTINLEKEGIVSGLYHITIKSGNQEIRKRLLRVD